MAKLEKTRRNIVDFVKYAAGDYFSEQDLVYLNHKIDDFELEVARYERRTAAAFAKD